MNQAWLRVSGSEGQRHGVPAVFLLNPVVDREGLPPQHGEQTGEISGLCAIVRLQHHWDHEL